MDPHYFMSKSELLGWINDTLGLRLTKVEETASGAIACQLVDALHPGVIKLSKVDFNAKNEYEMINNYKVLQDAFNKMNVSKHIEVAKLTKARPLDNIEFMQWLKSYFDSCTGGAPITNYDGPGRRAASKTGDMKGQGGSRVNPALSGLQQSSSARAAGGVSGRRVSGASGAAPTPRAPRAGGVPTSGGGASVAALEELKGQADVLDKEKAFYYSKLRDIELLCQTPTINEIPILKHVEAILYAPTAEEGRKILMDTQTEFAGQVFLEEEEAAAQEAADAAA